MKVLLNDPFVSVDVPGVIWFAVGRVICPWTCLLLDGVLNDIQWELYFNWMTQTRKSIHITWDHIH